MHFVLSFVASRMNDQHGITLVVFRCSGNPVGRGLVVNWHSGRAFARAMVSRMKGFAALSVVIAVLMGALAIGSFGM